MADDGKKKDPVAKVVPVERTPQQPGSAMLIDPVPLLTGGAVALVGVAVLVVFLWMVPSAAARESQAACRGLNGYNDLVPALCPGGEPGCNLPQPAPEFTALDITGKQVKLSDFRGKVVLLNFWASWCGVCKAEKPSLSGMAKDMATGDFVVVSLASDHNFGDAMSAVIQSLAPGSPLPPRDANGQITMPNLKAAFERAFPNNIPFQVLLDPPNGDDNIGAITQRWGIKAVPESALIDRKGNIRAYFVNKRDWETPVAQTCLRSVIDE